MTAAIKFTKKTLPQKEGLGEKLAKKRISLGLDPKDIEKAIRIRAKHIEAIENGRYDSLPPDVYVRGFVRNYANFLKLDAEKVMKLYERERGLIENVRKAKAGAPIVKPISRPKIVITPKTITWSAIILSALAIFLYIGWQVATLMAPPKLTVTSPGNNVSIQSNSVSVEGETDSAATLYINDVQIGVSQDGSFKERINLQNGVNIIKIRSVNKMGKISEVTNTVVAEYENEVTAATVTSGVEVKIVVGPRSASVLVEVDGTSVTEDAVVMMAGVTQTYIGASSVKITASDGGTVTVTVNGTSAGTLGADNEMTTKEFTK